MSISLKDFQKKYTHHINKGLSFSAIYDLKNRVLWDFDVYLPSKQMNLQRGLVWTWEQKSAFIISILKNQHIPNIVVIQFDSELLPNGIWYDWQVIDGKQRLTTLFDYFDDKFAIQFGEKYYLFSELPNDCQKQIKGSDMLKFDVHYSYADDFISDDVKISLFEDINWLGTPQDIEHMNKLKK